MKSVPVFEVEFHQGYASVTAQDRRLAKAIKEIELIDQQLALGLQWKRGLLKESKRVWENAIHEIFEQILSN